MKKVMHIFLALPWHTSWAHEAAYGIRAFAHADKSWNFYNYPDTKKLATEVCGWNCAGMVVSTDYSDSCILAKKCRFPVVSMHWGPNIPGLAQVSFDLPSIGRMAAAHFMGRGFVNFAFAYGANDPRFEGILDGYARELARCGFKPHLCGKLGYGFSWDFTGSDNASKWLKSLPKPVAVFAGDDVRAKTLSEICRLNDIVVPNEVSILGVEDDIVLCKNASPPLSSIRLPFRLAGEKVSAILKRLISGKSTPAEPVLLQPEAVVSRQSTDLIHTADPVLARAMRFIEENACDQISPVDVARNAGMSLRVLEKRFRKFSAGTPKQLITRVQLCEAQRLLRVTHMGLEQVAERSGFSSANYMGEAFRRLSGISPSIYREQCRPKYA